MLFAWPEVKISRKREEWVYCLEMETRNAVKRVALVK